MASDGNPAALGAVSPAIVSQPSVPSKFQPTSGKTLPQGGKTAATTAATVSAAAGSALPQSVKTVAGSAPLTANSNSSSNAPTSDPKSAVTSSSDPQTLVDQVNKFLNDSGRPDQFRVDPSSSSYIQQVNPANGAVVAEYSISEFPALARSVGASGLLIDDVA